MEKEKYIRVCPICKSPDIHVDSSNAVLESIGSGNNWSCARCGNSFPIVLEVAIDKVKELEEEPLSDELRNKTPQEMRVGAGTGIGIVELIFLLVTMLLMIAILIFR
ncbi:MAG TPA: hypothetical protein HA254_01560 [Candidatus Diapherotrites archaeon]|uniref:Uncharacterized protein n=1 Tax=Candidatus Iainarchaeum sp. TaxID=3101447 RepID=A0A7J4IYG6_9ARCH|nr:hypothetical protein [Candidatus Diapherotrites archaeon]